jgi:hypothetical protein
MNTKDPFQLSFNQQAIEMPEKVKQMTMFDVAPDFRLHSKYRSGVFRTRAELTEGLREEGRDQIYHVLSFGGGTQSPQDAPLSHE